MEYLSPDSYWFHSTDRPAISPPLAGDVETDVAILGAGITGLTLADLLLKRGHRVMVIEAGRVAAGTSGGTSGHLDAGFEGSTAKVKKDFGIEACRTVVAARYAAIDAIEARCGTFGPDCDFHRLDGTLYAERPDDVSMIDKEAEVCTEIGLACHRVPDAGLPFATAAALRFPGLARFHPLAYLRHLASAVRAAGGIIHEQTRAAPPSGGDPCTVKTEQGTVTARVVVVATHSPYLGLSQFDARVAAYQSYVLAVRPDDPAHGLPDGLFWDTDEPYHYTRRSGSTDPGLILVGGADHKTGQGGRTDGESELDAFVTLEDYVRRRYGRVVVERQWSAEYFNPSDGLPFVGAVPLTKNVFFATGYGGEGLTYGTLSAGLLADLATAALNGTECDHPLAAILSPSRVKPLAAVKELVTENLNVAKEAVTGFFAGDTLESLDMIPPGTGRLVHYQGRQLAVYRDNAGTVHTLSPTCTHAGCSVNWNPAGKTWDCPCHGGRYLPTGERAYGPPPHDLARVEV